MPNMEVVQCPFYITHSSSRNNWQKTVTCERIQNNMGFMVRNMLRFYQREELEDWLEIFCSCSNYSGCPYYQAIYEKYERNPDMVPDTEQYDEYEELVIRPARKDMKQISLFEYMEEKNHENIGKETEESAAEESGTCKKG